MVLYVRPIFTCTCVPLLFSHALTLVWTAEKLVKVEKTHSEERNKTSKHLEKVPFLMTMSVTIITIIFLALPIPNSRHYQQNFYNLLIIHVLLLITIPCNVVLVRC